MANSMKVAVIGSGWAGARHAQAFVMAGARVKWAVDVDQQRAEAIAAHR